MLNLIKPKFFPLLILWLVFNIVPMVFVISLSNDLNNWKSSINQYVILSCMYCFSYGINYLIGCYYFYKQSDKLNSEAKQSILHLFTITRNFIVIAIMVALTFLFKLKYIQFFGAFICIEVLVFVYHFILRQIKQKNNEGSV